MSQPSPDAKAVVRALEALTTQVRRGVDTLTPPVVEHTVEEATTPVHCPLCPVTVPLSNPEQATAHFRAQHPEQRLVGPGPWPQLAVDDGPTTPATTCSAQYHGHASGARDCIRAGQHHGDHIDEQGYHWSDTVAVYPTDNTVRTFDETPIEPGAFRSRRVVAHWHPVAAQLTEERQELASMVGEFVDAQVQHARAAKDRLPCPYCGDRQLIPRPQLVEHIARLHPDVRTSPADDEEPPSWERRKSLAVLLSRAQRGVTPLTSEESGLLRRHVETEIREANTARSVAAGNKRHVQTIVPEIDRLTAELEDAEQRATGFLTERDQAQAAIERVRAAVKWARHNHPGLVHVHDRLRAALDGTEQPTTERPDVVDQYTDPRIIGTTEGP